MWPLEEIEELNPQTYPRLVRTGAAFGPALCEAAAELENLEAPHIACFFQLPFPVAIEDTWHSIPVLEKGVVARVKCRLLGLAISEPADIQIMPFGYSEILQSDQTMITQIVALIPLWGIRLKYYERYRACLHGAELANRVIVRPEENWDFRERLVAMTSSTFEANLVRKMYGEMRVMLRRLLPAYAVLATVEAPQPQWLWNFFVMPLPGRVTFNRPPIATVGALLKRPPFVPAEPVTVDRLKIAMSGVHREPTRFEQQLMAMRRLRHEGEPALALIGSLSLAEWEVNRHLRRRDELEADKQTSLWVLFNKTKYLSFVDDATKSSLLDAVKVRNELAHGLPPQRQSLTDGNAHSAGREDHKMNIVHTVAADRAIDAVFRLYRLINDRERAAVARP